MELNNLKYTKGARGHKVKTYGRGFGSGIGKTSGKGNKGQKQRKSGHVRLGFEGGQTPIYRKIPKVGFNNFNFRTNYNVVTLREIVRLELKEVSYDILVKAKVIIDNKLPLKIIGNDALKNPINISADVFSAGALKAIEAAEGKAIVVKKETVAKKQ